MESTKTAIVCLGKSFESENERREYFREELRKKLPELKKIDGFPIGEDEDIINLSDPPYYTACPNPWLNDFINEWEEEKKRIKDTKDNFLIDAPYASDVSEGKNNPIYNAHSYHTKVPHPAIMRYILHYTQPGDVVLDGFAGTGMTGVAAGQCEKPDLDIKYKIEQEWISLYSKKPSWGLRKNICSDLSPIASFISYNYNKNEDLEKIISRADEVFEQIENEMGFMYKTLHKEKKYGTINYVIWSEVFSCPNCNGEINFWDKAIDRNTGIVSEELICDDCKRITTKNDIERLYVTKFDSKINQTIKQPKYSPVLINYFYQGKRFEKRPDKFDFELINKIDQLPINNFVPTDLIPKGDKTNEPLRFGYTNAHHFYTIRNLHILSAFWKLAEELPVLKLLATSILVKTASILHNVGLKNGKINLAGALPNAIYIPSIIAERNLLELLKGKLNDFIKVDFRKLKTSPNQVASASDLRNIRSESIDYIFVDPPFGSNIMYSELNFIQEAWLKVKTNNKTEAIENKTQQKRLLEYQKIMTDCFSEYYRVLKTSRWMTVEFSNTGAAVWNGIQTALQRAGFIVANVSALDKQQGSFNAQTSPTAVKQDLVISCYKPSKEFEINFKNRELEVNVWDFLVEHLQHLPIHLKIGNSTTAIIERSPKILYDRLISFYLMRGLSVPIDAKDFQEGLRNKFIERDGMYFTIEQASEYDEKKSKTTDFLQLSLIISNESDAIEWLKDRLRKGPEKYNEIMPDFRIATQSLRKGDTLPELQNLLNENFIQEANGKWRMPNLNEAKDRDTLRNKSLLKEFDRYVAEANNQKVKKLKEVRLEALRAGFKNCWDKKDLATILKIGDMMPQNILLEDEQMLMYYDIAKDRM